MYVPYKIVDAAEAPAKPVKSGSKSAGYFREIILQLEPGKVAVIEPEEAQSPRGIKVSVGRVASSMGTKVTSWSIGDDPTVYVELNEAAADTSKDE
jgi:hypothetical protein